MKRLLFALSALFCALPASAQERTATSAELEFFEKKVRPILVEHCYECHAATSKKVKGGLRVDSRQALLDGGDNGPALVPGDPERSRMIEAVRYTNVDLKMPRKSKLPDPVIADLIAWVKMGAPWPAEKLVKKSTTDAFDVQKRKEQHWSWQPICVPAVPAVKDQAWPAGDVDRFLLARLEARGLTPARDADASTLLRRLSFDLVGLPPTRREVEEFTSAWKTAGDQRQEVWASWVDRMLASPHFGERWARHWLDLVRYAESRGHEFDYTIPNAYQYRDYVIRAFNEDVPYNQFVQEHIAGDLLANPRQSPNGGNESILGTGFWFLGEECHSPVDIRQDQADRFDNRIDVMTKTFLGLTVACARCHDHKFDAISTRDYYALFGVLESSNYRLARFDTMMHNRKVAEQLADLRTRSSKPLKTALAKAVASTSARLDAYLLTAAGVEDRTKELDPALLKGWQQAIKEAARDEQSPLHGFARIVAEPTRPPREVLEPALKRWPESSLDLKGLDVVIDYRRPEAPWLADDLAFGLRPARAGDLVLGSTPQRPIERVVERGAAERDASLDTGQLTPGTQNESGSLGSAMRAGRTLRSSEFTLKHGRAFALLKGSGMVYAGVGHHIMLAGPLHGGLVQKFNTGDRFQWVAVNLMPYKGQRIHLEFTPNVNTDFALIAVVQGSDAPTTLPAHPNRRWIVELARCNSIPEAARLLKTMEFSADDPWILNWQIRHLDLYVRADSAESRALAQAAAPIVEQQRKILGQLRAESRLAPAMQDGSGTDERVFVRGNPKTPGDLVPRRFLEALAGPQPLPIKKGSGRQELAGQMTDPARTPFITRVYVNRVWHHLFGRGIVGSVDNFGVLGEQPTHAELLDYLADRFARDGWSLKKLVRTLVLSRAYRMSSVGNAGDTDPGNQLLHRARIRRLEGEAIRDSILRVSGRLNPTLFGPSVPIHLTPFQEGRGRPASGPLDGEGRRSIYLAVRRNFLSSFLLAFDTPSPFSTVGRRTVSNVPAQALILMNDPFVHQQADVWAKRIMTEKTDDAGRVHGMYLDAFARPPSAAEVRACMSYLGPVPDQQRWADLAHVLVNTKEFYFVN